MPRTPEEAAEFGRNLPPGWAPRTTAGSEMDITGRANAIEAEERSRYQAGLGGLESAYTRSSRALGQGIDPDLLFSKAADTIGARARFNLEGLRSSLGARGLNPNSGAAQGLLNRIGFDRENALVGATRDIAIENQRQRHVAAAQDFANALNLAQYRNSPVPQIGLDASLGMAEINAGIRGLQAQERMQASANRTNLLSGIIGGGLGLLGRI